MLPLPGDRNALRQAPNNGLVFSKFIDKWPNHAPLQDFDGLGGTEKKQWVDKFADRRKFPNGVGNIKELEAAVTAITDLATNLGCADDTKPRPYQTTGPFITGMGLEHPVENGFLWHHTLGVPYLPGSSIKGMMRAWAEEWCEETDAADRLFGSGGDDGAHAGCLIVFDALPTGPVKLMAEVITPHTGDWRITETPEKSPPADWVSPVPIPFLAVAPGAEFQFALAVRQGSKDGDLKKAYDFLEQALEWIGAGAKTAVGFGRFLSKETIAKLQAEERERIRIEQITIEEAERNWRPQVNERVHWVDVEDVTVTGIKEDMVQVVFDDGEPDEVHFSELKKIT